MVKGMYYYIRNAWKKPDSVSLRESMVKWRAENSVTKIDRPTRLDRARSLGYKAKKGYVIVRVKVPRGGRQRARTNKARKPKKHTIKKIVSLYKML